MHLVNGDKCVVGQHVIARPPSGLGMTIIARVVEILQIVGSVEDYSGQPSRVLLRGVDVVRPATKYRMPHIDLTNEFSMVRFTVRTFHQFHGM